MLIGLHMHLTDRWMVFANDVASEILPILVAGHALLMAVLLVLFRRAGGWLARARTPLRLGA